MIKFSPQKKMPRIASKKMTVTLLIVSLILLLTTASVAETSQNDLGEKNKTIAKQQFELNLKDAEIIVLKGQVENQKELNKEYRDQLFWRNVTEAGVIAIVILAAIL
jgi:cell division protein FtsB